MKLQSVQYDLQHDFAWVADEADQLVVQALLQFSFLGKLTAAGKLQELTHGMDRYR